MSSDEKLDGEWLEALEVEAPADESPADDTPVDDAPVDDKPTDDKEDNDTTDDNASDTSDDTSDDSADDRRDDDAPKDQEEPDEKAATKEAIKEALAEIDSAKQAQADTLEALKKEVAETLYPEGIDRQLRDSDGDPITGIDDLTKLINPKTGELFTDEEAGAWLLQAQQKLNKDIEAVESFIEKVAEVNTSIKTGAERVAAKYGDILGADEKLRERLIQGYDRTLVKDPKTGVTINNPIDVEEFFDIALGPRLEAKIQAEQAAAIKAKEDAIAAAKAEQADRGDLKPSGKSDNIDPEDKEWAEAIKSYEQGA